MILGCLPSYANLSSKPVTYCGVSLPITPACTRPSRTNFLANATLSMSRRRLPSTHVNLTVTGRAKRGILAALAAHAASEVHSCFMALPLKRLAFTART